MDYYRPNLSAESLPLGFSNGLVLVKAYHSHLPIEFSIYIDNFDKLALFSSNSVFFFSGIGFAKELLISQDQLKKIAFVRTLRRYICLLSTNVLSVRSSNMLELSSYKSETKISCLLSNEAIPELPTIITSGPGYITIWAFRVGAREIFPLVTHTHLFSPADSPQLLCLDSKHGKKQQCYIAISDSLIVIQLDTGIIIIKISNIHCFPISCLLPLVQFGLLITGSTDGVVKVWGSNYNLLHTFIGHEDIITDMLFISNSAMILTSSRDSSIRLWNLETGDLRNVLSLPSPAYKIYMINSSKILGQSKSSIFDIEINVLYKFYRSFPSDVTNMSYCSGSNTVVVTNSSMLAIIHTKSTNVVNALWIGRNLGSIKQVSLLEHYYRIFILTEFGNIIIGRTDTFPIEMVEIWKGNYSCFTLYNMILEESVYKDTLDKWFKYDISSHENKHTSIFQAYILLVGSSTGMLTRLNLFNGGDEFNTVAHDCEIFRIISHSRNQQILTCSFEGIIKIWRVYPHVHECLLQVTAFELISAPSFIIASKKRICFAINYADQAINTIEMFDTQTLNKYTHTCHNDHHDTIVDLAVCSSIGIFVSVGMDETVRFWDENNALLSVLSIYCCPSCICFSNERGDVFIALAEQIFLIEAQIFIPDFISNTLLGISLLESNMEVISLFYGPLDQMTSIGLQKLKVIDNRNQSQIFQIQQDSEERESLPNIRTNEHYYFNRNSGMKYDLEMLIGCTNCLQRVGKITAIQSVNIMESWNKYYGMYFSPPYEMNIKFDDKLIGNNQLDEGTYIKEFSKASSNNFFHRRDDMIFKCGFVPNSMYLENSYLEKSTITDSSIFDINKHLFQSNDKSKDNFNKHNSLENSLLGDNIISKFEEKSQYHIENIPEQSEDIDQHLSPSPTILSITNQRKGNLFGHETSIKLINKKIAKSSDKPILRNDHNQSCTSIQNTLLPLSTPFIPRILEQFLSEKWFKDLFPDLNSKTFPTNCSLSSCYSIIFSTCSHTLDNLFSTIEALQSIILLDKLSCFSGSDKEDIFDIIIDKLLCPAKPIIFLNNKEFKFASLKVLNKFCFSNSMKYVSYLLTEFLLGDFETRHIILDYLKSYGLSDPFKYLSRELDSWNMVAFSTSLEKPKLLKYTMDWLQELIMSIRNSTNSFTLMTKQYPSCIDALNLLVKRNTVLELQSGLNVSKPRSPSPPDNFKLKHQLKSVVTLPEICFSQKIIRMGETHNSECHNERETTLVNYTNSPFLGILKNDTSKNILLHLPVQHQNLTLSQSNQSRIIVERLQQKRKYFLLTQSQLI